MLFQSSSQNANPTKLIPILRNVIMYTLVFVVIYSVVNWWRKPVMPVAPNLQLQTLNGQVLNIQQLSQDKPVLIYFWGTWCPVCRQTSPSVQKFAQTSDYPVVSIAVSSGSNQDIQQYMQQKGLSFTTVNDQEGELFSNWQGQVTPSYAIIKDGNMVQGFTGIQPAWVLRLRLGLANFS